MMAEVIVYSKETCPYCDRAKALLKHKGVEYTEIRVDEDPAELKKMIELSQRRTVPQIIIDGKPIGGFDDMVELDRNGELNRLLKTT